MFGKVLALLPIPVSHFHLYKSRPIFSPVESPRKGEVDEDWATPCTSNSSAHCSRRRLEDSDNNSDSGSGSSNTTTRHRFVFS